MFCEKCGTEVAEGINVCPNCGTLVEEPAQPNVPQPAYSAPAQPYEPQPVNGAPAEKPATPGKGLAIAGMILGIISLLCFPAVTGTLGIIFGAVAKSKGCKSGMATAGIVCGVIGIALWLLMLVACDTTALLFSSFM